MREGRRFDWRQVRTLVERALEVEAEQRADFLDRRCDDPALRAEIDELLTAFEQDRKGPLDAPATAWLGLDSERASGNGEAREDSRPATVGAYRLLEEIGRGGMGTVYRARPEQQGASEIVALKLLRWEVEGESARHRFEREREILSTLDHPLVARLLDSGTAGDGRPYLVMEYVPGVPITEYCDARRLPVRERIELLLEVLRGVEYAHRNLVVHRDLKPSNILVGEAGAPKVLDFGIAKLIKPAGFATESDPTATRGRAFTPNYASPEHAIGGRITTASDTYSLGVVLYELLTGQVPFDWTGYSPRQMVAELEKRPPRPPSAALATSDDDRDGCRREVAARRGTTPEGLQRTLRGDLDTIVSRALRVEPEARYASVEQLGDDLRRYLDGRPIRARPSTLGYRARKFVERNRLVVVNAAVVSLLLVATAVGMAVLSSRLAVQRDRAEQESRRSGQMVELLIESFQPLVAGDADDPLAAREVLDRAVVRLAELEDRPALRAAFALTLAQGYKALGEYATALDLARQSLEQRREHFGAPSSETAESLLWLGLIQVSMGDYAAAELAADEALEIRQTLFGPRHREVAEALYLQSYVLFAGGDPGAAEPIARRALEMRRELLGEEHEEVATSLYRLSDILLARGELREGERVAAEALDLARRVHGDDDLSTAAALNNLASAKQQLGDYLGAEPLFREAVEAHRQRLGEDHPEVATAINNLAIVLQMRGELEEAEPLFREALSIYRRRLGQRHPLVANARNNLATLLVQAGDPGSAGPLLEQGLADAAGTLPEEHPVRLRLLANLAYVRWASGDYREAERLAREALGINRRVLGPHHPAVASLSVTLADVLNATGRHEEALDLSETARRIFASHLPSSHWLLAIADSARGASLAGLRRWEEAEPLLVHSFERLAAERGENAGETKDAARRLERFNRQRDETALAVPIAHRSGSRS